MSRKIKLKVCGMCLNDNIAAVGKLLPDYMGFIFYPPSPRFVGDEFQLSSELPAEMGRVGIFVNESNAYIRERVRKHNLGYVQLHGIEQPEQCEELKRDNIKVIKAFSIDQDFDFEVVNAYQQTIDLALFDTKGVHYGGNARSFDWSLLRNYNQEIPFFLSGGLTPQNLTELKDLSDMNIHAIDVNSGVEFEPGKKDVVRIKRIIDILETI